MFSRSVKVFYVWTPKPTLKKIRCTFIKWDVSTWVNNRHGSASGTEADNNWNDFASRQSWPRRGIYDAASIDHFALCECSFRQIIEPRVWDIIETYEISVTLHAGGGIYSNGANSLYGNWLHSSTVWSLVDIVWQMCEWIFKKCLH